MPRDRSSRTVGRPGGRRPPARRLGHEPASPSRRGRVAEGVGGEQVEGRQAVRELLRAGRRRVHEVLIAAEREPSPVLAEIASLATEAGVPLRELPAAALAARARTDAPQGVVARAAPLPLVSLEALAAPEATIAPFLVLLDGVSDPRNLGAILRSALGAGATGAVLARHGAAPVTPTVTKAAAGAIEHLPIALVPGIAGALPTLSRAGVWLVGLDAAAPATIDSCTLASEPIGLVLGAEGRGLAPLVRRRCDGLARIELVGQVESLNVAAAAAVACFTLAGLRRVNR